MKYDYWKEYLGNTTIETMEYINENVGFDNWLNIVSDSPQYASYELSMATSKLKLAICAELDKIVQFCTKNVFKKCSIILKKYLK